MLTITSLDPRKVQAASYEWHSWLWQKKELPRGVCKLRPGWRIFVPATGSIQWKSFARVRGFGMSPNR